MAFENSNTDLILGDPNGVHVELLSAESKIVLYNAAGVPVMVFDGTEFLLGDLFATLKIYDNDGILRTDINGLHSAILGNDGTVKISAGSGGFPPKLELQPTGMDTGHITGEGSTLSIVSPHTTGLTPAGITLTSEVGTDGPSVTVDGSLILSGSAVGEWQDYTPTWTTFGAAPALGDGTLHSRWCRVGNIVHYTGRLLVGTTTTFGTGGWIMSLPLPAATGTAFFGAGAVLCYDQSTLASRTVGAGWFNSSTTLRFNCPGGDITGTVPFVWASGDQFRWSFTYEVA